MSGNRKGTPEKRVDLIGRYIKESSFMPGVNPLPGNLCEAMILVSPGPKSRPDCLGYDISPLGAG